MRLLNTDTLELEYFASKDKPLYAILSHTWGKEEVLYEDARRGGTQLRGCKKGGIRKVLDSAAIARQDGYDYIWIDTCCIDKSSSAELSESINAMFSWYQRSDVCYVLLEDYVHTKHNLQACRWFTRGWTLQELIAPRDVRFFDSTGVLFGTRVDLSLEIAEITGIDQQLLRSSGTRATNCFIPHTLTLRGLRSCRQCWNAEPSRELLDSFSLSAKMSWSASRVTTRIEDIAYCLMGLFDVHMPLLYGESMRAFRRLQEEIVKQSNDKTILLWEKQDKEGAEVFATHPNCFKSGRSYQQLLPLQHELPMAVVKSGIELDVWVSPCILRFRDNNAPSTTAGWVVILNCSHENNYLTAPAFLMEKTNRTTSSFQRLKYRGGTRTMFKPLLISYMDDGVSQFEKDDTGKPQYGVRHKIQVNDVLKPEIELRVIFDRSTLERRRILFHESTAGVSRIRTTPAGVFVFPRGLAQGYNVRRVAPAPGNTLLSPHTEDSSDLSDQILDPTFGKPSPFGAIQIENGEQGNGFYVIWDCQRGSRGWAQVLCHVCPYTDFGPAPPENLTDIAWVLYLHNRIPMASSDSAVWQGEMGDVIQVRTAIRKVEFVGREIFEIGIQMFFGFVLGEEA